MMTDKQKYEQLMEEVKNLPGSSDAHNKLFQFSQQLNDELVKQLKQSKE